MKYTLVVPKRARLLFGLWLSSILLLAVFIPVADCFVIPSSRPRGGRAVVVLPPNNKIVMASATKSNDTSTTNNRQPPEHVVIAGAGVIGTCTAYYLAKNHGIRSTLVDVTGTIAPAASGKAGGFLALDWNDYALTGPLTRRSFALHQQLADEFGATNIQYRRLTCAGIGVDSNGSRPGGQKLKGVEWVDDTAVLGVRPLGTTETIAQVHPKRLCERLWQATQELVAGCQLVQGKVVGVMRGSSGMQGAKLDDGSTISADAVLYACGPWTGNIMMGIKYHSAVIPTDSILSQCVFFSGCGDPEVYVRPDATAYCTGFPEAARVVTEQPGEEQVLKEKIDTIVQAVRTASSSSKSSGGALSKDPILQQACYLPTTDDGLPVMGELSDESGCYIAAGHSCWGILMGPASGESMADLIATGQSKHVDLSAFAPSRYRNLQIATN